MQAKLRELRGLLAKATPGPWESDTIQNEGDYGDGGPDCKTGLKSYAIYGPAGLALLDSLNSESAVVHEDADEDRHYAWDEVARRNAALVVAAVNAMPELLAIAEAAEDLRADARRLNWLCEYPHLYVVNDLLKADQYVTVRRAVDALMDCEAHAALSTVAPVRDSP